MIGQVISPNSTLLPWISDLGVIGVLAWVVIGALREWWYTAAAYRRMEAGKDNQIEKLEKDRDEWKSMALRSLTVADKATTLVDRP